MTLIEIAIVLVILGLLAGMTIPLLSELSKHQHYKSTQKDMDEIKNALAGYAGMYWRLPYADTNGDGVQDTGQLSGNLPYVTLGLGAIDSWRNRYYYDVNTRLVTTATQSAFCTGLQNIGANEDPRVAFSSGGTPTPQAVVALSGGESCALDGGNTPFPDDRDYESYAPTDTFDDLVIALTPSYLYGKLNCGGGSSTPTCSTYTVRNQRTGGSAAARRVYIQGGSYPTCTRRNSGQTFTLSSGQTINVYPSAGCTGTVTVFTYNDAVSADVNGECRVDLIGTNPPFSLTDR